MTYWATLHQQRTCRLCQQEFPIYQEDLALYHKLDATLPVECFSCRLTQRLAAYNRRKLYRRKCSSTGRDLVSWLSPDKPFKAFHRDAWYGDSWSPFDYGREFDFSRPFFEQFYELMLDVPVMALATFGDLDNSEFINDASFAKNCYLSYDFGRCQDLLYTESADSSSDLVDCLFTFRCELLYECIGCSDCYNLKFSRFCTSCSDSWFLRDCVGCKYCYGCANLRQKQYCIFNQPCSPEQFQAFMQGLDTANYQQMLELRARAEAFFCSNAARTPYQVQTENCLGDWVLRSRNAFHCFSVEGCEDCRYCSDVPMGARDCIDVHCWGNNLDQAFNSIVVGEGASRVRCSLFVGFGCYEIDYSYFCLSNAHHLFGCIGPRNASYAILNRRYTPEEYERLRARIIAHMQETGEWGRFCPPQYSYFGYNETLAQIYFPRERSQVLALGWKWSDADTVPSGRSALPADQLPLSIDQASDALLDTVILCAKSAKPFKLTRKELQFYREQRLPLPRLHPEERHAQRVALRRGYTLREVVCAHCGARVATNHLEQSPQLLVCAACFEKVVE